MDIANQLITIFCEIDDFCKEFTHHSQRCLLTGPVKGKRGPACALSTSEIMTILVLFQMIRFRDFKTFYNGFLSIYWQNYFPNLPSYNHFVELISRAIFPLALFTQLKSGKRT